MRRTIRLLGGCVVVWTVTTSSSRAQSTCLPADSSSVSMLARLQAMATDSADTKLRSIFQLPLLTTAQAATQVVQVVADTLCTHASRAFNASIVRVDATDDNPSRPVYLFKFGTLYVIQGLRHGYLSAAEIHGADWSYLAAFLP